MKPRSVVITLGLGLAILLWAGAGSGAAAAPLAAPAALQTDCMLFPVGAGPEQFCAFGVFPENPIAGELGRTVPLPEVRLVNDTDREMRFTLEWTGENPAGWGPVLIHEATLDPRTEATFTDLALTPHELMQVGRNTGNIGWSVQGGNYVATVQQPYEFLLFHDDFIAVPVRWCAIEGSPQAQGQAPGETVAGRPLLNLLQRVNDEIWTPAAHIVFRSAIAPGIPVIADPAPPEDGSEQLGDVDGGFLALEPQMAQMACEQAWAALAPEQRGLILVNVRRFVNAGLLKGVAPGPNLALYVDSRKPGTGERGDDLCGQPRNLLVGDVTHEYVAVADISLENDSKILAHELGHALFLGHGNGLDDNHDGLEPPQPGPRRYDEYCDPLWLAPPENTQVAEDQLTPFTNCADSSSLMNLSGSCPNLRPLQAETARAVAKLVPGALFPEAADPAGAVIAPARCARPPCGLPADIFLTQAEMATTPAAAMTSFSHTVLGPLPPDANNRYLIFADLDNDPATGCAPDTLDLPTEFQGVELVTSVTVAPGEELPAATPEVWQCRGGALVAVTDPAIRATAYTQSDGLQERALFGIVSLHLPDALRGPAADVVRLEAVAQQVGAGGELDRLPDDAAGDGTISLLPPPLPGCEVDPPIVNPGGAATLTANGLPGGQTAEVYLGEQLIATGAIDGGGAATIAVVVPGGARLGARAVTVMAAGSTANAVCALLVDGPSLAPATTAALTPAPNGAGWHNQAVAVTLSAGGSANGPAIRDITYSAAGATTLPATTVPGDTATVTVDTEGPTVLTFFATDQLDNQEAAQTITINIDKTPPAIVGARAGNTARFTCADDLSGIAFCTGPTRLPGGANPRVTGTAEDFAGNSATANVAGSGSGGAGSCATAAPTTLPAAELLYPRLSGAFIELQAEPLRPDYWTRLQWQDAHGRWNDIDGWQGKFNPNRRVLWYVGPERLGERPFRWLIYATRDGALLGVSRPFALPARGGEILRVGVALGDC